MSEEIKKVIENATKAAQNKEKAKREEEKDDSLKKIKEMIKIRERLKRKNLKTRKDKIELNMINKAVRSQIREKREKRNNEIKKNILEHSKSTKKIRKELSIGKSWITYMKNKNDEKIYNRKEINELIARYYRKLYDDDEKEAVEEIRERERK